VCGVQMLCDTESLHLPSSRSGATEKASPPPAAPFTGGQRPTRERREPDRFSLATLIAAYTEASGAGFSVSSSRVSSTAMYVNLDGQADRIAERARSQADFYFSYSAEVKDTYLALPPEAQICACIAVDHDDISTKYGARSPQAALMREVYAAAAVVAACIGVAVPRLAQEAVSVTDESLHASADDMFDDSSTAAASSTWAAATTAPTAPTSPALPRS